MFGDWHDWLMRLDNWEERALLGERLAHRLGRDAERTTVLQLLLDDMNTAVTYRTALALLERRDQLGLELILTASTRGDDNTNQWLGDAVAHFRARSLGADDDYLRVALGDIIGRAIPLVSSAAEGLLRELNG